MTVQLVPTDLEAAPRPLSRARTAVQSTLATVTEARVRLGAIDTLRGAVMVINALETLLAFLDCEKYPPSLLYLAMTLGPALLVLAALPNGSERGLGWLTQIGRVPLFFYVLHIYGVHALAVVASWLWLGRADWLFGAFPPVKPAGFGFSLPIVYALTLLIVAGLALACRWYGALKSRRSEWWWSDL